MASLAKKHPPSIVSNLPSLTVYLVIIHHPPRPFISSGLSFLIHPELDISLSSIQFNSLPRPRRTEKTTGRVQSHPDDSKILETKPL
ncbi:hypothetical protein Tco_0129368, partial [Tanacetum coccineum]